MFLSKKNEYTCLKFNVCFSFFLDFVKPTSTQSLSLNCKNEDICDLVFQFQRNIDFGQRSNKKIDQTFIYIFLLMFHL
jgi:hypothetical protein